MGNLSFDTDFLAVGAEIAEQLKTSPDSNNGQLRLKMTNLAVFTEGKMAQQRIRNLSQTTEELGGSAGETPDLHQHDVSSLGILRCT